MKPIKLSIFLLFLISKAVAQEPRPITVEGFAYPDFGKAYNFRYFSVEYPLSDKTDLIVRGLYEQTPGSEIFQTRFLVGRQLSEKLRVVGGALVEWDLFPEGANQNLFNPEGDQARKELYLGMEYEPKPNWLIDVGYRHLLNNPKFTPNGFKNPSARGMLNIGSKWKF